MKRSKAEVLALLSNARQRALSGQSAPMLATVSGVATTKASLIHYADTKLEAISLITTKSFQVKSNSGYREPIICEIESGSFGNAVGLRNQGMEIALAELKQLRERSLRALLNVSISGSSAEEFATLAAAFAPVAEILELNFSCPHAQPGYGSAIGSNPEITAMYVKAVIEAVGENEVLVFAKLTPNVEDIGLIAQAALQAGADGLVAINTVGPVEHREKESAKPILFNRVGGKSGHWVKDVALTAVRRIRQVVPSTVPIIGMGGISSGTDIVAMLEAGADVIGIGSAFGKVKQQNWPRYCQALLNDSQTLIKTKVDPAQAQRYWREENLMEYRRYRVLSNERFQEESSIITLDGALPFGAGEFVFLWLPEVGEKPFSIALSKPLTFIVKEKGPFTSALLQLKAGDSLFVRGLYGEEVNVAPTKRAFLVAGGTGVAVLPALAERLDEQNIKITTLIGMATEPLKAELSPLEEALTHFGPLMRVIDDGVVGRVLSELKVQLEAEPESALYLVGPQAMMSQGALIAHNVGLDAKHIFMSLELSTMCGVGMCGECACGERLTCQWGTFVTYDYLLREAPELL